MRKKILKEIKKKITNKKNVSPTSNYVRATDARNAAIKKAFGDNF